MSVKHFTYLICAVCLMCSCKKESDRISDGSAFFGGEIINPSSDHIIIYKSSKILDTVYLDKNNRFNYTFKDFEPGLYNFYDEKESQVFLIHPNDSIMIRLNTIDFDESLVFNGIGEKENNYLINLFLETEKQEQQILEISQLEPLQFEKKLSEIRSAKLEKLKAFNTRHEATNLFNNFAEASINYNYYYGKEAYPFINHSKNENEVFKSLSEDFFDFRDEIDYNNNTLKDFRPYVSFLRFHFNNIALQEHFKHSKENRYNKKSLDYNLDKLRLIGDKVTDTFIKNRLLHYNMIKFINASTSVGDFEALLESFKNKSTNNRQKKNATKLVESYKRLKPGHFIPNVLVINKDDKTLHIEEVIKNPSIIYFWDTRDRYHLKVSHERAKVLHKKYPEFNFIAICVNELSSRQQADVLQRNHLSWVNEYHFENPEKAKKLLSIRPISKVFVVDRHAKIVNPKGNMFDISIEHDMLGLLNK